MKKSSQSLSHYILICVAISFIIGSCCPTCYTNYTVKNQDELNKRNGYQSGNLDLMMKTSNLQAPLLSQKGQVNTSAWGGNGWGLEISNAVTNHLLLTFKYANRFNKDYFTSADSALIEEDYFDGSFHSISQYSTLINMEFNQKSRQHIFEAGSGYYSSLSTWGRFDVFGGLSFALAKTETEYNLPYSGQVFSDSAIEERRYFQYFVQSNFGYVNNFFEAAIMGRISYFHFISQDFSGSESFGSYKYGKENITFEPAFRVGFGYNSFRIFFQDEYAIPLNDKGLHWIKNQYSVGLIFRIGDKAMAKKISPYQ